jgi:hypothetical protein
VGFTWRDALEIGKEVVAALIAAIEAGKGREEAIREASLVLERLRQIDADVDAAARGSDPQP